MKILHAGDYRRMPWKNGKGETVEIAVFPPQASVSDFDWRISMASVASDGPFSVFEGIERTLSVLSGEGIELFVQGETPVALRQDTRPHAFAADAPTAATLLSGPITDLNVMTRRGRFAHQVSMQMADRLTLKAPSAGETMVLVSGACRLAGSAATLAALDMLVLQQADEAVVLEAEAQDCRFYVIDLRPAI